MNPRHRSGPSQVDVAGSYEEMSRRTEHCVVAELKRKPTLLLCASAGGTPTRLYELLAARARHQPGLFKKIRVLQIDEWGGLPRKHPASCETDLRNKLLLPLGIEKERYTGFRTDARDPQAECLRIARWLAAHGPIDVCILGLGVNGHVAMNEPAPALIPHAHVAGLTESSLHHPMLQQLARKPSYGLTIGMADILASKRVVLMVSGSHKRAALQRALKPEVTTEFPASFVQLHPRATVFCDREAMVTPNRRRPPQKTPSRATMLA